MLMSTKRLLAEVAKCDIVCVNCHRVRTRNRELRRPRKASRSPAQMRAQARWDAQAAILNEFRDMPCVDCGSRFHPCALDFDHREPSTKLFTVTRMVGRAATDVILAEVAKCDIVCANCHRVRTTARHPGQFGERE
jgi:hypothetical protein